MPRPGARTLFEDREILVLHCPGAPGQTLVTFADLTFRPHGGAFWGRETAEKLGMDAIGFVAKRENWYPAASVAAAAAAVRAVLQPRSLAYGYSMGAYGALKHGARLGIGSAIAVAPQVSIAPGDVPRDNRFHRFFRPGLHRQMRIQPGDLAPFAAVLADPYDPVDWAHARMAAAAGPVHLLRAPHAGHAAIWLLTGSEALAEVLDPALSADIDGLRAVLRDRRARSGHWFRLMGRAAARLGHADCAETLWARAEALGIPPSTIVAERAGAMADRAHRQVGLGRVTEAIETCRALARQAPDAAVPIGRSAHVLLAAGAPAEAESAFRRALSMPGAAGDLHVGLSLALAGQGRRTEALAAAREGHAARPRDAEVATHYAHMLAGAGRQHLAEAERIFRAVLDRQPGAGLALFGLGHVLHEKGQRGEALLFAQRAVARLPGHHDALNLLARMVLQGGEATRAEQLFRRLQAEWPARPEPYGGLAQALMAQDRRTEAIGALRRGLAAVPGDATLEAALRRLTRRPTPIEKLVTRLRGVFGRPRR